MKWASALSQQADLERAIEECANEVLNQMGGSTPDLAVVFVSPHHAGDYDLVSEQVARTLGDTESTISPGFTPP